MEAAVERTVEELRQVAVAVAHFDDGQQAALLAKMSALPPRSQPMPGFVLTGRLLFAPLFASNGLVRALQQVDQAKAALADVDIPLDLLECAWQACLGRVVCSPGAGAWLVGSFVDRGQNPHLYTRACLDEVAQQMAAEQGKADMFKVP